MAYNAAEDKDRPEYNACTYEEFLGGAAFQKRYRGSTPEDINVHHGDDREKNESEHTASLRMSLIFSIVTSVTFSLTPRYVEFPSLITSQGKIGREEKVSIANYGNAITVNESYKMKKN